MKLDDILAVTGQSGLFKLVGPMKNGLIVESLTDGRRLAVHGAQKVLALKDVSIYTSGDDEPLKNVFDSIHALEKGGSTIDARKADNDALRNKLGELLPTFDRERVYVSDIKKLFVWYNQLHEKGLLLKDEPEAEVAAEAPVEKKASKSKKKEEAPAPEAAAEPKPKKAPKKKAD